MAKLVKTLLLAKISSYMVCLIIIVLIIIFRSSLQQQSVDNTLPRCPNDELKCTGSETEGFENPLYHLTRHDNEKTDNIYESLDD